MLNISGSDAGTFSACNPSTDPSFDAPTGMALFTASTETEYAYVPNNNSGAISLCVVTASSGAFTSCQQTPVATGFGTPQSIALAGLSGGTYAYIASGTAISQCSVDTTTAALSSCAPVTISGTAPTFFNLSSIVFHESNDATTQYAYILDKGTGIGDGVLYKCTVNQTNGNFSACTAMVTTLPAAIGKVSFFAGTNATYAYFINNFNGTTVAQSIVNGTTGALSVPTPTGTISANSQNVTVQTVNGTTYAYIPDSINEAITRCTVSPSDGSFNDCAALTTPDPADQSVPFDVVF